MIGFMQWIALSSSGVLATTQGLRDVRPPVPIPTPPNWLWWFAAGAVLVALGAILWSYWRGRSRPFVPSKSQAPPDEEAFQQLEAALTYLDDPRDFCFRISGVVRRYLEARFDLRAPERTTEEFLQELTGTAALSADQKAGLQDFLAQCDLVKFARYEPSSDELRSLYDAAVRLVQETRPLPAQEESLSHANGSTGQPAPSSSTP